MEDLFKIIAIPITAAKATIEDIIIATTPPADKPFFDLFL